MTWQLKARPAQPFGRVDAGAVPGRDSTGDFMRVGGCQSVGHRTWAFVCKRHRPGRATATYLIAPGRRVRVGWTWASGGGSRWNDRVLGASGDHELDGRTAERHWQLVHSHIRHFRVQHTQASRPRDLWPHDRPWIWARRAVVADCPRRLSSIGAASDDRSRSQGRRVAWPWRHDRSTAHTQRHAPAL